MLLKTFQRLGYFAVCAGIPAPIIRHVFRCAALVELPEQLQAYDASTARDRHTTLIREFLGVTAYGTAAREVVVETCLQAARTRDDLPDLINMAIEELIRQRFELPAFSTLLRIARTTRNTVNRRYQLRVCELLEMDARQRLLAILSRPGRQTGSVLLCISPTSVFQAFSSPERRGLLCWLGAGAQAAGPAVVARHLRRVSGPGAMNLPSSTPKTRPAAISATASGIVASAPSTVFRPLRAFGMSQPSVPHALKSEPIPTGIRGHPAPYEKAVARGADRL